MADRQPLVSIVVVNWNGLDDTKDCIKYLKDQTYKNFETIVVDNGSTDGSVEHLRKLSRIKLVENPQNLGFTGGHIAGYNASQGEYILLLNNDAIMDKNYIELAVETMLGDESIGALGGRAYLWDDNNPLFDTTNKFYGYQNINPITAEGIFTQDDNGETIEVNNVSGSCVIVSRNVIEKLGYLHNPFFAYYEESDLFARMKRANYKVVYQPELAIWHANAKTSIKKAPTFSLYMMMRNRFRFAVRNFDTWSLLRFIKFYLVMGIASTIRIITDPSQRPMHKAYAKAFFYNIAFGIVPFWERLKLNRKLGASDYNYAIVKEQTPFSLVIRIESESTLKKCLDLSHMLDGANEISAVTSNSSIAKNAQKNSRLRICLDKGYFNTHPENLAAVTAKHEWMIMASGGNVPELDTVNNLHNMVYEMKRSSKTIAASSGRSIEISSFSEIMKAKIGSIFMVNKSVFIDAGGLLKELPENAAWRALLGFGLLNSSLKNNRLTQSDVLIPYEGNDTKFIEQLVKGKISEAESMHQKIGAWGKFTQQHYHTAQLTYLVKWLFSFHVSIRLKAARIKNLAIAALTINRRALAVELKHIQNEVSKQRYFVDMVKMKQHENDRLHHYIDNPKDTIAFIIIRDRLELMKDLIKWMERQGLNKIVFVDNDSRLPTLLDFLQHTKYQVLSMQRNTLQTGIWTAGIVRVLCPDDFYIVTDPDLVPTRDEKDVISHLYKMQEKFPHHLKVGLGLRIDDIPDYFVLKKDVIKWESQFWKHELEPGAYEAGVDTTFALYKPYTHSYLIHPSIRTGEPYTARHLPWYSKPDKLSDEEIFYRMRLDHNVNTWNKDHLPERYKKELAKNKS